MFPARKIVEIDSSLEVRLKEKLAKQSDLGALRTLPGSSRGIDFCSNDYLGLARSNSSIASPECYAGSTGSRLLSGDRSEFHRFEVKAANFHGAEAGLVFNSGYLANLGLLSCLPKRSDWVIFDELCHASIRDGIRLSGIKNSYHFKHNDVLDLELKLKNCQTETFVVLESVYSMDGDLAPITEMTELCAKYGAHLIVDEAHAGGIFGPSGRGLVSELGLESKIFARIFTFGKALGSHGALVAGTQVLIDYLVNFCRAFMYTTALPPSLAGHLSSIYDLLPNLEDERNKLFAHIAWVRCNAARLEHLNFKPSPSPIQTLIVPGNIEVKALAAELIQAGFDIRPILYPTVAKGTERLRWTLHSFNTHTEIETLFKILEAA